MSKTPFAKGNQLFRENNLEAAIQEYKKSLKKKATYIAYENMGMAFERLKQTSEAEEAYGRAISLNPHSVRAARYFRKNNKGSIASGKSDNTKGATPPTGVRNEALPVGDVGADTLPEELQV